MMTLSQSGLKMNKKETFDEQLKEIAGGNYAEDFIMRLVNSVIITN